uniref:Cystatin domain-containing protein n=1 Tax=Anser cygnoides TaxID=8845 RepID=A0A8B9DTH3_ANSCY
MLEATLEIGKKVKPEFERREKRTYDIFRAIEYKTQVVAGINYFIKVCQPEHLLES